MDGFVHEYTVRVPKINSKRFHVLSFGTSGKVDVSKSSKISMQRENNLRDYKLANDIDVTPKYGAGSEYGKDLRDELKRKKYGIQLENYSVDDQPWIYKQGIGKDTKKYKGVKEGQINVNSEYYVFMQNRDGIFDAFPIESFYKMYPTGRYKHLSIEEAETEFKKADKYVDHYQYMISRRMKKEEEAVKTEVKPTVPKQKEDPEEVLRRKRGNVRFNEDNEALDESSSDSNAELKVIEDRSSDSDLEEGRRAMGKYAEQGVMEEIGESGTDSETELKENQDRKGDKKKEEDVKRGQISDSGSSFFSEENSGESDSSVAQDNDFEEFQQGKRKPVMEEESAAKRIDGPGKVSNERLSASAVERCLRNRPYRFKHLLGYFMRTTPEYSEKDMTSELFSILGGLDVRTIKIGKYQHMYIDDKKKI